MRFVIGLVSASLGMVLREAAPDNGKGRGVARTRKLLKIPYSHIFPLRLVPFSLRIGSAGPPDSDSGRCWPTGDVPIEPNALAKRALVLVSNRLIFSESEHSLAQWLETASIPIGREHGFGWPGRETVGFASISASFGRLIPDARACCLKRAERIEEGLFARFRDLFWLKPGRDGLLRLDLFLLCRGRP
ncbi:hypothetical protein MAMC_01119 [Methylacidimicrobium cyclopophantes]|uniref:Uncharacterized protein n=1 Tax=Methylacidimicrobium cyclopophantes TaxID=1041766 RepID=A0A5E6MFB2_9BACT|nr:hypothetical protein MAMC_01119 [Methylacidimicrobium cyclopophantes]